MMQRDLSVDALRGFAVLGMVLSGSIAFGDLLPAWMFHAQVPPPLHKFHPNIPGITWVDWVFPFFLFAMGAAMPLAFAKFGDAGPSHRDIWTTAIRRGAILASLAIFTQQLKANVQTAAPSAVEQGLSILAFVLCGLALAPRIGPRVTSSWLRAGAWLAGLALLIHVQNQNLSLTLAKSDIILIVLANMAFFGTLLFAYTRTLPLVCAAILMLVGAVWIAGKTAGSPSQWLYNATPAPWLYKFDYLKYLFIVVPGIVVGRWLLETTAANESKARHAAIVIAAMTLLVGITAALFARDWLATFAVFATAGALLWFSTRGCSAHHRIAQFGLFLLLLGLLLEPWAGGIKKDPSHFTYWLATSGLACFALLALCSLGALAPTPMRALAEVGQNPLVAYVVGSLLLLPLLHLTDTHAMWSSMKQNVAMGVLKGLLFTFAAAIVTIATVRLRWIWRS